MTRAGQIGERRREGLAPIAAAFAVFALLIQALLPAAAMAAQMAAGRGEGSGIVVCTLDGARTIYAQQLPTPKPKGFAGLPCQDCLAAAIAFVAPPVPSFAPAPALAAPVEHHVRPAMRLAFARAPPRPPGQGPPTA